VLGAQAAQGSSVQLGSSDISTASGLRPSAVVAAASARPGTLHEGDGALVGGVAAPSGPTLLQAQTPGTTSTVTTPTTNVP
jgi:hypothetical protein